MTRLKQVRSIGLVTLGLTLWWGIQAQDLLLQAQRSILGLL